MDPLLPVLANATIVSQTYLAQVKVTFESLMVEEKREKLCYEAAWDLRRLYAFAFRRQADSEKREQSPRDTQSVSGTHFNVCHAWYNYNLQGPPKHEIANIARLRMTASVVSSG